MNTNRFDLSCRQCATCEGSYLMDCFCVLCVRCYAALGKELLFLQGNSLCSQPNDCKLCGSSTEFESENLTSLPKSARLLTVANRYLASMYMRLKQEIFVKHMDQSQALESRGRELSHRLEQEQRKSEFCKSLLLDLTRRFKISLDDIEPTFYFQDKFKILSEIFIESNVEPPVEPERKFDETKKKESKINAQSEPLPGNFNPFLMPRNCDKLFSFSAFKIKENLERQEQLNLDNKENIGFKKLPPPKNETSDIGLIQSPHARYFATPLPALKPSLLKLIGNAPQIVDSQYVGDFDYQIRLNDDLEEHSKPSRETLEVQKKLQMNFNPNVSSIKESEGHYDQSKNSSFNKQEESYIKIEQKLYNKQGNGDFQKQKQLHASKIPKPPLF